MEAKKKVARTCKPVRTKPDAQDGQDKSPWPTLDNELLDELARNIEKKRNEPGSIPYPFDRD